MSGWDAQQLVQAAIEARERAYARYSTFQVGAALITPERRVFLGCNVENASYGLTICAERVAVANAISAGQTEFAAIAVASRGGVTPCGACRQVLAEFATDLPVLLADVDDLSDIRELNLSDLLPSAFDFDSHEESPL